LRIVFPNYWIWIIWIFIMKGLLKLFVIHNCILTTIYPVYFRLRWCLLLWFEKLALLRRRSYSLVCVCKLRTSFFIRWPYL
jgi:hypothetical protein